jgi:hypothetical protein
MMDASRFVKLAPVLTLCAVCLLAGCLKPGSGAPEPTPPTVVVPVNVQSDAPLQAAPVASRPVAVESPEPRINLRMADAPVRLVLQKLAELGNIDLIVPANLNRTISVQYVNVPVSTALSDVLARSGLRLGAGPRTSLPFDTVTVFYQLPANIDSLSVDGIVRRFGVSREMAELIAKSRRP